MKILICSDGTPPSDNATQLAARFAAPLQAETTLLGIVEDAGDEPALRQALETQALSLRQDGVALEIVMQSGEPVRQILNQTSTSKYDLVVIGARRTGATGHYWRSERTYEVIKAIHPPVLVAIGEGKTLDRFLVCTGGKAFIDDAVQLTGKLAAAVGARVTLLHVMAEPPAIYADLVRLEEDVDQLLESNSELGLNLRKQKEDLGRLGVIAEVRVRHGIVVDQVFDEVRAGNYNLIVTGTPRAGGAFRHYIMGNLTRSIVNGTSCPVLVARAGEPKAAHSLWRALTVLFAPKRA
ncbi:MAG: universal stress protein [Verrucomicrobiota bacterium]